MFSLTWSLTCCSCSVCNATSTFSVVWWRLNPIWSLICSSAIVCCIVFTFCLVCKMLQIICTKREKYFELQINSELPKLYNWNAWCHSYLSNNWNWNISNKTFCSTHLQPCLMKIESHLKFHLFLCHCVLHCLYLLCCLQNVTNNLYQGKNIWTTD